MARATSRRGVWSPAEAPGAHTGLHLFDRAALEALFLEAAFVDVRSAGVLIETVSRGGASSVIGPGEAWQRRLESERRLTRIEALADLGKHLMATGRRPGGASNPVPA